MILLLLGNSTKVEKIIFFLSQIQLPFQFSSMHFHSLQQASLKRGKLGYNLQVSK